MREKYIIAGIFALILAGCGSIQPVKEITPENSKITGYEIDKGIDTSGFRVNFDIHMTSSLIFIPNYFGDVYGTGNKYEEAIDEWTSLKYKEAEKKLLEVEESIASAENHYYPDDIAFVKESLGLLYYDMADYRRAYDYLIDAYVTMEDIYGGGITSGSSERFYPEAVRLALCRYYYSIGDYDRCLKEIQDLRDLDQDIEAVDNDAEYLKFFIEYMLNDIEATIHKDRGEYEASYDIYAKNIESCGDYINKNEDPTLGKILSINACKRLGDWFAIFLGKEGYAEKANNYYEVALKICDYFSGDLKEKYRSEILLNHGKFLSNFESLRDNAWETLGEAIEIQEKLIADDKTSPDIIDAYIIYAEAYGFIEGDFDMAILYYDKALDIAKTIYGDYHPATAKVYESMGRFYGNKVLDTDLSIEYFEKSVGIYKDLLIENNIQVAGIYLQLAGCYKIKGEEQKSDDYLERASSMYDALGIHIMKADGTWE